MNIKNRQQALIIVAAAGAALFIADKVLFTPLTDLWKDRAKQVAALQKQVTEGSNLLKHENDAQRSWAHRWAQMKANTLPNNESQAEQQVHKAFDRWMQDSRVTILSLSSQWKHDTDNYKTLECRVEASGNLSTVSRFLHDIEKDPMALKLQSVELSARDNYGQQIALGLQISGLVLTPQEQKP